MYVLYTKYRDKTSMDPKSQLQNQRATPPSQRQPSSSQNYAKQREAALSMVRSELDSIYSGKSTNSVNQTSTSQSPTTQQASPNGQKTAHTTPEAEAERWRKYHSAWQDNYCKYYEHYYLSEIKKNIGSGAPASSTSAQQSQYKAEEPLVTQDEALSELRQNIIKTAQDSATKVRRSRHFIPIASAVIVVAAVALMQYNQVLIANVKAYMSPGDIAPQNIIVNPNADIPVGPETKMIIPKINVDAPIVMNVGPSNEEQLAAMSNGIAHVPYPGASAEPGQIGNSVFSAHSSSDWTDTGAYKFIFVQLERLSVDDIIYINYKSKRYSYKVYETKVVPPTDIDSLKYTGNEPIITLITCTPLGTAEKRLLIFAKQVSPDPKQAPKADPKKEPKVTTKQMTGTAPTFIERLFGAR